jgi:2-desacetyl-2-hydroxyethyl bacteriochlorophyllide A dehydrogenase
VRAAVFASEGVVEVRDVPRPEISRPDDVLIRVDVCGICGSDVRALSVPPQMEFARGVVMGHEFAGEIVDAGPDAQSLIGQRVVVLPNINCGQCAYCKAAQVHHCEAFEHLGATRDGAFAELCVVPAQFTYPIPDDLDSDTAALAEPLACVLNGTTRAGWHPGVPVVVLGAGPIGLLFVMLARAAGVHPLVVSEPMPERAEWARRVGADVVIDPTEESLVDAVRKRTGGIGAAVVVDAVGSLLPDALACLRKGGRALIFGLDHRARCSISPSDVASRELAIEGVYITNGTFPLALDLLASRSEEFAQLITDRLELADVGAGVDAMRAGKSVKVLVKPR